MGKEWVRLPLYQKNYSDAFRVPVCAFLSSSYTVYLLEDNHLTKRVWIRDEIRRVSFWLESSAMCLHNHLHFGVTYSFLEDLS